MASSGLAVSRRLGKLPLSRGTGTALRAAISARPWVCRTCARDAGLQPRMAIRSYSRTAAWAQSQSSSPYAQLDYFERRHVGPDDAENTEMLKALSPPVQSMDEFVSQVIPPDILAEGQIFSSDKSNRSQTWNAPPMTESQVLELGTAWAGRNKSEVKSFIGGGYYGTITPGVIKRNILENPAWYTSYTPYQPEISQGRLESLLNFQTLVADLTALPIANASLLDEGTAAAEAMTLSMNMLPSSRAKRPGKTFVIDQHIHPQTINVLRSRAEGFGIKVLTVNLDTSTAHTAVKELGEDLVGVMVQYPDSQGGVKDWRELASLVHSQGALLSAATDLLALTVLTPPGEWGADIAFGSAQRFGVPMGFGGPHAAFFAVGDKHKRKMPGRLVGVSKDRLGDKALRLSLQTREQHIRREKATSNVCTAQALLANMSALYAVYHGPDGLRAIAERVMKGASVIQGAAEHYGWKTRTTAGANGPAQFDTISLDQKSMSHQGLEDLVTKAIHASVNIGLAETEGEYRISIDETTTFEDLTKLASILRPGKEGKEPEQLVRELLQKFDKVEIPETFRRTSKYLTHPVFNSHHSETELLRYIYHLQSKDLSLVHSMIPLGSCTMKLNGSTEMALISLPGFANMHPFAPKSQTEGYQSLIGSLQDQLQAITGMDDVSLQPNSGAQGEFAGLRVIRMYHDSKGPSGRDICLIPVSAHGTNPASAAMSGMRVVPIKCDAKTGNLDLVDLEAKCAKHSKELAAIMITYPSTFGVFEPEVRRVCEVVHAHGGQVYMDGANMNAQIGLCSPGAIGADVCHLNLHKTFCIPHGGGGPGVGPIGVKAHLAPFLPSTEIGGAERGRPNPVSSAPFGSASILPISWAYNALMGAGGLTRATKSTLLNANYLLSRLRPHYSILYTNRHGRCAHEFILDVRPFRDSAGVEAIDIAKRLQDYGFHAPTMSWPVANTLMIEPTESESREELDRFADALVAIRAEIRDVEEGRAPRDGNVLKMAPHPVGDIVAGDGAAGAAWDRPYSREQAAYPLPWLREKKFWPTVARVDDTYGDLNLFCTCPPVEDTTGEPQNISSVHG